MYDVKNDVIIACPFKTDPRIFHVWHKYFMPHLSSLLAFICLLR